jgi:hypothetical protein
LEDAWRYERDKRPGRKKRSWFTNK